MRSRLDLGIGFFELVELSDTELRLLITGKSGEITLEMQKRIDFTTRIPLT